MSGVFFRYRTRREIAQADFIESDIAVFPGIPDDFIICGDWNTVRKISLMAVNIADLFTGIVYFCVIYGIIS